LSHRRSGVVTDVNSQVALDLLQEKPLIDFPFRFDSGLLAVLIEPMAIHEQRVEVDLVQGTHILPTADSLAVDRAKIFRTPSAIQLGIRRQKGDKADNGERNDDRPQPSLMFSNRPKHNFNSL